MFNIRCAINIRGHVSESSLVKGEINNHDYFKCCQKFNNNNYINLSIAIILLYRTHPYTLHHPLI